MVGIESDSRFTSYWWVYFNEPEEEIIGPYLDKVTAEAESGGEGKIFRTPNTDKSRAWKTARRITDPDVLARREAMTIYR